MLDQSSRSGEVVDGPICILEALDNHTFELNQEALESILLQPGVCNKKVAVVSVAGAFRKGKSFLLDFFLRYLQRNVSYRLICTQMFHITGLLSIIFMS